LTEAEIQRALAHWIDYRRHLCLPNVNGGLGFWSRGEMDFIAVTGVGHVVEIEIKCTLADLRREWRNPTKVRKHNLTHQRDRGIRRFFICTPAQIIDKALAEIKAQSLLDYAGVLSCHEGGYVTVLRAAQNLKTGRKLNDTERMKIGHLAAMRLWDRATSANPPTS
jgi:hypothetical protein